MDLGLKDAVVLITGGSDGLGAALAERLVGEGARVAICGRNEDRLKSTESHLASLGGDVLAMRADVTVLEDLEQFVSAAVSRWGRIDGLVNNAGRSSAAKIEAVPDEEWLYDYELKVLAAVRLVRLVLPHMRANGSGSILNILAVGAKAPGPGGLPTNASRAAGLAITKSISKELAPENIRVNAILIGQIESGQARRAAESSGRTLAEVLAERAVGIPLGRVGKGDEFATAAAYLLSRAASYITGSSINLDGGVSPVT